MSATYPAADLAVTRRDADEELSPGCSWHWELYARILAGLQAAAGDREPCTPELLAAAEAVMSELAPITEVLARVPAPRRAAGLTCPAGSR